jgi:hypothetical protein
MSAPGAFDPMNEGEEDAALVDSFFLPGGILDPDNEEEETQLPNITPFANISRVPSNPWSDGYNDNTPEESNNSTEEPAVPSSPQHLILGGDAEVAICPTVQVRPPPGYNAVPPPGFRDPAAVPNDPNFRINAADNLHDGREGNFVSILADDAPFRAGLLSGLGTNNTVTTPDALFHNRAIQRPFRPFDDTGQQPGEALPSLSQSVQSPEYEPEDLSQAQNDHGSDLLHSPLRDVTSPDPSSPGTDDSQGVTDISEVSSLHHYEDDEDDAVRHAARRDEDDDEDDDDEEDEDDDDEEDEDDDDEDDDDESEAEVSDIHHDEDDEDDEGRHDEGHDDEGHDDEDEDDDESEEERSNSGIPSELLNIPQRLRAESLTSSLSTSSRSSGDQDSSDGSDDSEVMEDLAQDSGVAAVVQPIITTHSSTCSDSVSRPPDPMCTAEKSSESHSNKNGQSADEIHFVWQNFLLLLSTWSLLIIELPKKLINAINKLSQRAAQKSAVFGHLTKTTEALSSQTTKLANTFHAFSAWMVTFKDIATALSSQLASSLLVSLTAATKTLIVVASFLFQVWKYSLIEAVEESNVAICYLVFYFMPYFCSLLMEFFNIPHWAPHLITSAAVFLLCNQVRAGPLHLENVSIFKLAEISKKTEGSEGESRPRDERACRTILTILRFVLPIFFIADGFSTEFGTIMGVSGASRLTTAYMMSLVRKNLVSSPVGWVSWAIQVLVATYYPAWSLLDQVVLVVGLSSIRLIRYLEGRRVKEKRRNGKHY